MKRINKKDRKLKNSMKTNIKIIKIKKRNLKMMVKWFSKENKKLMGLKILNFKV